MKTSNFAPTTIMAGPKMTGKRKCISFCCSLIVFSRNQEITWELPTQEVTTVSLVFREYGYIAATDFKIFYNDSTSTSIFATKSEQTTGNIFSLYQSHVQLHVPGGEKVALRT